MIDVLKDLLTEAMSLRKQESKGKTLHGIPDWKPTANVWLKSVDGNIETLIGLFIEHQAPGWRNARRLTRADMGIIPGLPERVESLKGPWPYNPEGRKWDHHLIARREFTEIMVELDAEGLHSHAPKKVVVEYCSEDRAILGVRTTGKLELSNMDNLLWVEAGMNIWPILDRECKVRIAKEVFQ